MDFNINSSQVSGFFFYDNQKSYQNWPGTSAWHRLSVLPHSSIQSPEHSEWADLRSLDSWTWPGPAPTWQSRFLQYQNLSIRNVMSHVPQLRRSDNLKYRYMKKEKQSAHAAAALECGSFNEQKFLTGKFLIIEFHQKIFSGLFITI